MSDEEQELSFATLAAGMQDESSPFGGPRGDESSPFRWAGAGRRLFSAQAPNPTVEGPEEEGGEGTDDQEENEEATEEASSFRFKPAIPLPDLVEVVTGEEGWTEIYSRRLKLYRYDKEHSEWKERGDGKMKILHNEENGQYRLVMRREKVLKVVCNHLLSPDTCLQPLMSSDTSWCWHAINFAEAGPGTSEILAVKLSSREMAEEFKEQVDRCVENISRRKDSIAMKC